jgi:hypothetical protein
MLIDHLCHGRGPYSWFLAALDPIGGDLVSGCAVLSQALPAVTRLTISVLRGTPV